ncbi:MAG: BatD family protein [Anaerolineae bacterium]|jgi:hypothetical protein|nr:BatD family protein [Anaerolineae bacterium]
MRIWVICLVIVIWIKSAIYAQDPTWIGMGEFFVQATVDQNTLYQGEPVILTVRFAIPLDQPPPQYQYITPDWIGWWRGEQLTSSAQISIENTPYAVYIHEQWLYPSQAGEQILEAGAIVIASTVFQDRIELRPPALSIHVIALPEGAPTHFQGAVGRFETEVMIDPPTVTLGQPVTLRFKVIGAGNLEAISTPTLTLPEGWRAYPNTAQTLLQNRGFGEKYFEWRLMADRVGSHPFPAILFSYFDPQREVYQTYANAPFQIDVLPTVDGVRELPRFERTETGGQPIRLPLKPLTSGTVGFGVPWWTWIVPMLVVIITGIGLRMREQLASARSLARKQQALTLAKTRIQNARQMTGEAGYRELEDALAHYLMDHLNLRQLTAFERNKVIINRFDPDQAEVLLSLFRWVEDARYAPEQTIAIDSLAHQLYEGLKRIERT